MSDTKKAFRILTECFGIEPEYRDNWGILHRTDPEAARRILAAKGILVEPHRLVLDPQVTVASLDRMPDRCTILIADPEGEEIPPVESFTLKLHGPDHRPVERVLHVNTWEVSVRRNQADGLPELSFPFPTDLETGSYEVAATVMLGGSERLALLRWAICPFSGYVPEALKHGRGCAGIALSLYGVRSEKNWGVGDFGDLKELVDWARDTLAADFIGLNPLHALTNRRPFNHSPYLPSSRLYRNFIYLDIPAMKDFRESPPARALVEDPRTRDRIRRLRESDHVDYEGVAALKLEVLRVAFRTFLEAYGEPRRLNDRWESFEDYIRQEGVHLERFATFCALAEHFEKELGPNRTWRDWPAPYRDPQSEEVARFYEDNHEDVLFRMYLQWQISQQLSAVQEHAVARGMIIGLYHDEALAVDRNGADFWARREFYHDQFTVGAPPDAFAPEGQNWGFPPPDTERLRGSGYDLFLKKLDVNCSYGGALRIDHVMQFHHLFWIPAKEKASAGVYVKGPEEEFLSLTALESQRNRTLIIGEDLGTLPSGFRERLMARDFFSYRLFYFERDFEGGLLPTDAYPASALVSISTHDLPTLASFWAGLDIEERRRIGQLSDEETTTFKQERGTHKARIIERLVRDCLLSDHQGSEALDAPFPTAELHAAVLRFLFRTPAKLACISQEDLFLDPRQQNIPGTTWERPNWSTKMLHTVEELRTLPEAVKAAETFRKLSEETGRSLSR